MSVADIAPAAFKCCAALGAMNTGLMFTMSVLRVNGKNPGIPNTFAHSVHTAQQLTAEYTGPLVGLFLTIHLRSQQLGLVTEASAENAMFASVALRALFALALVLPNPAGKGRLNPVRAFAATSNYIAMAYLTYKAFSLF